MFKAAPNVGAVIFSRLMIMNGMILDELKETMTTHDEIEFSYRGVMYDFQKDPAEGSRIKIVNAKKVCETMFKFFFVLGRLDRLIKMLFRHENHLVRRL